MSLFACTTAKYDLLYARWLEKPGDLLDLANWKPGETLLDLCGGTGAVSMEALRRGAPPETITLYDLNPRCPDTRIRQVQGKAEESWFTLHTNTKYDVIVCRQAIAYLDLQTNDYFAPSIRLLLNPHGRFVFNNFIRPKWKAQFYSYQGHWYVEASGFIPGWKVFHLQWCLGSDFDVTVFHWHQKETLLNALQGSDLTVQSSDTHWLCTRKPAAG